MPAFDKSLLTFEERRKGQVLAEQLHRAQLTEQKARKASEHMAAFHARLVERGKPLPYSGNTAEFVYIACSRRTLQALQQLQEIAARIGKRLAVEHFSTIIDFFRSIARPVEPIPLETLQSVADSGRSKHRSDDFHRSEATDIHIDTGYLQKIEGIDKHEASQKLWLARNRDPQAAIVDLGMIEPENIGSTTPRSPTDGFYLYTYAHSPVGGLSETLLSIAQEIGHYRAPTLEKYRDDDERRMQQRITDARHDIATYPAMIAAEEDATTRAILENTLRHAYFSLGWATHWLNRSPQDREPDRLHGRSQKPTIEERIEQEIRVRNFLSLRVSPFLKTNRHLPAPESEHRKLLALQCKEFCFSTAHYEQVTKAGGIWNHNPAKLTQPQPTAAQVFADGFRQHIARTLDIPVYIEHWGTSFLVWHSFWFDRLHHDHWLLLRDELGRYAVAKDVNNLTWAGHHAPNQWDLDETP